MQSKNISTDQQLLERGWAEMAKRLDEEPVGLTTWDLPIYFIMSLSLLALSYCTLSHSHVIIPTQTLAQVESKSIAPSQKETQLALESNNSSTIQELAGDRQEEVKQQRTMTEEVPYTQVKNQAQKVVESQDVDNRIVTTQTPLNQSEEIIVKRRPGSSTIDPVIAAQLSIPVSPSAPTVSHKIDYQMVQKNEFTARAVLVHEVIDKLDFIPTILSDGLAIDNESFMLKNTLNLPKRRSLIPDLKAGYAYSFLGKSGFNVGFGLNQSLKRASRLSLNYGVNFTYFGSVNTTNLFNNRTADSILAISDGEENGVGAVNEALVGIQTDAISQVGLSTSAKYRITPRFSIALGPSLMYQKITATQSELLVENSYLTDDQKVQYDEFVQELDDKYRMTIDLKGSWHITPRLSVQPYWKIQPVKSQLRTNQIGLDLSFALTQG